MKRKPPFVTGEYSRHGYTVFVNGRETYSAGNCYWDSTVTVKPGSHGSVSLRRLRQHCGLTARHMARERHVRFAGIERVEETA